MEWSRNLTISPVATAPTNAVPTPAAPPIPTCTAPACPTAPGSPASTQRCDVTTPGNTNTDNLNSVTGPSSSGYATRSCASVPHPVPSSCTPDNNVELRVRDLVRCPVASCPGGIQVSGTPQTALDGWGRPIMTGCCAQATICGWSVAQQRDLCDFASACGQCDNQHVCGDQSMH